MLLEIVPGLSLCAPRPSTTAGSPTGTKKDWPHAVEIVPRPAPRSTTDHARRQGRAVPAGRLLRGDGELAGLRARCSRGLLDRKDLTAGRTTSRRHGPPGLRAQLQLGDLDTSEKTFPLGLAVTASRFENQERLNTDFFLAFSQYNLAARSTPRRFRRAPIRLPERRWIRDLEEKAACCCKAQRSYIETIKYGNARWASAAGFPGGLALRGALRRLRRRRPIPSQLGGEARHGLPEELRKKIRILPGEVARAGTGEPPHGERLGVDYPRVGPEDQGPRTRSCSSTLGPANAPPPRRGPAAPERPLPSAHRPDRRAPRPAAFGNPAKSRAPAPDPLESPRRLDPWRRRAVPVETPSRPNDASGTRVSPQMLDNGAFPELYVRAPRDRTPICRKES
jgi:hypothetical protein